MSQYNERLQELILSGFDQGINQNISYLKNEMGYQPPASDFILDLVEDAYTDRIYMVATDDPVQFVYIWANYGNRGVDQNDVEKVMGVPHLFDCVVNVFQSIYHRNRQIENPNYLIPDEDAVLYGEIRDEDSRAFVDDVADVVRFHICNSQPKDIIDVVRNYIVAKA